MACERKSKRRENKHIKIFYIEEAEINETHKIRRFRSENGNSTYEYE